jgi:UDP-N-acetylglucosamine 2-epimerase (non-hydrolysing)/GDP/UDP-N,N'-diacetylbacillosamine 2-epimerase (hydrolysing)
MRTLGVVTVARSDYGIYLPLLRKIQADPDLQLHLIVAGMHLSPEFGLTAEAIEADDFEISERVEMLLSSDTPTGIAKSMGLGTIGFSQAYSRFRPDMLVVLGDRFEMHTAALAALPFKIPVAHIHGGELTQGVIDDALRHCITKLSHIHFVATEEYGRRVLQMGEESWRIIVSGALSLDNLRSVNLLDAPELESLHGMRLDREPLLVTFHPVTLDYERTEWHIAELLSALDNFDMPIVFSLPNSDTGGRVIISAIKDFVSSHSTAQMVDNLGTQGYFSLMSLAAAMVGNSSSGIIEAPSFNLPVVNIGSRQEGRIKAENVIDVGYDSEAIVKGVKRAIQPEFRQKLKGLHNPYGTGNAAEEIIKRLKEVELDKKMIVKRFYNVNVVLPGELDTER